MKIVKYIMMAIYAIVCLALIILILKQNKGEGGASGTIVSASANNFYEKNKGKTVEGRMKNSTIALIIIFAILTLALGIIYII